MLILFDNSTVDATAWRYCYDGHGVEVLINGAWMLYSTGPYVESALDTLREKHVPQEDDKQGI